MEICYISKVYHKRIFSCYHSVMTSLQSTGGSTYTYTFNLLCEELRHHSYRPDALTLLYFLKNTLSLPFTRWLPKHTDNLLKGYRISELDSCQKIEPWVIFSLTLVKKLIVRLIFWRIGSPSTPSSLLS